MFINTSSALLQTRDSSFFTRWGFQTQWALNAAGKEKHVLAGQSNRNAIFHERRDEEEFTSFKNLHKKNPKNNNQKSQYHPHCDLQVISGYSVQSGKEYAVKRKMKKSIPPQSTEIR